MFIEIGSEFDYQGKTYVIVELPHLAHPTREDLSKTVPPHFTATCVLKENKERKFAVIWELKPEFRENKDYIQTKEASGSFDDSDKDLCNWDVPSHIHEV